MSNLSVFSALHEKVLRMQSDYSIDNLSQSFCWVCLETILSLDADEIEESITDGSHDGGIDAIYIAGKDVHVFTFKYAQKFEASLKNFPETDLDVLCVTMDRIYMKDVGAGTVNDALYGKVLEIWDLFDSGVLNFKYYVCSNKAKPTDLARKKLEHHLGKYRNVEFFYYDVEDLVRKIMELRLVKVNGVINFIHKQYFERTDGPLKGVVASISALDLVKLVQDNDNPGLVNQHVFNDNVRVYLKLKNRINKNIYETALSDTNYEFWYLNNGITIVCERCDFNPGIPAPRAELINFQIVNGGQTTHALFEAFQEDQERLANVDLIVRICQTTKRDISERISETTNSQNPVRSRDLRANDRLQRQLELEFESLGYYYERKRNQHESAPRDRVLSNELLGQLYMAFMLDMPSEAKNNKSFVFGEKYDSIFHEGSVARQYLAPYLLYVPLEAMKKDIQRRRRRQETMPEAEAFVSRATFHVIMCCRHVAKVRGLDIDNDVARQSVLDESVGIVRGVVQNEMTKRGPRYTSDKFFKEVETNDIIKKAIDKHFEAQGASS